MPALGAMSSLVTSRAVGVASDLATAPGDRSRMLPVHPLLADLFPGGGLRRGGTVAVRGSTSLLFALLARATETGSWAALVGLPNLGLRAASELGVAVERLALVRHPGVDLPKVVAALLDGVDLVVVDPARLTGAHIRRLSARARHRGAVLVATGPWPGADLELTQETVAWSGLGDGHGHLTARELRITARGKGAATRPVEIRLNLPGAQGVLTNVRLLADSFGASGTDRLSPPSPDAPKDPELTLPAPRVESTNLTVVKSPAAPLAPNAARGTLETLNVPRGTLGTFGCGMGEAVFDGPDPAAAPLWPDVARGALVSPSVPNGAFAPPSAAKAPLASPSAAKAPLAPPDVANVPLAALDVAMVPLAASSVPKAPLAASGAGSGGVAFEEPGDPLFSPSGA